MNEWDWLSRDDPAALLESLPSPTERKLRLFGVACCYQNWDILGDPQIRDAVVVAEQFADGRVTETRRAAAESAIWEVERVGDFDQLSGGYGDALARGAVAAIAEHAVAGLE